MWRHCVFVAISVVAVAVGACSKESNSTRDGRSMEDARTVDTSSESAADVRDSGEARDTATEVGAVDGSEMESDVDEVGDEAEPMGGSTWSGTYAPGFPDFSRTSTSSTPVGL